MFGNKARDLLYIRMDSINTMASLAKIVETMIEMIGYRGDRWFISGGNSW